MNQSQQFILYTFINVGLQVVRLHFNHFVLESGRKQIRTYDGNDTTAPLLHTFIGASRPSDNVYSTGNTVFVSFVTDDSLPSSGFTIEYCIVTFIPGKSQRFMKRR